MPPCYNAFAAGQTGVCEHMDAMGAVLRMELYRHAWPVCPLMLHGLPGLPRAFVLAARQAALVLAGVSAHRAFMLRLTQFVHRHYHL